MRRYLLDSGSANDYVHRRAGVYTRAQARRAAGDKIGIGTPVLGELLGGLELSATRDRNRPRMMHQLASLSLWLFDKAAALEYARIYAMIRRAGALIQQIDMQIAAIAFSLGNCAVITKDSDFGAVPGLDVEDWSNS